jgi:hypothetical protein
MKKMQDLKIFILLLVSLVFIACQTNEQSGNNKSKDNGLQDFEGTMELLLEGYYTPCQSNKKIKLVDKSQNAYDEIKNLGLPRMQPCYTKFKGIEKTDTEGNTVVELHQLYQAKRKIPEECLINPLPFGVLAAEKEKFRMQINPFDNIIKFQDIQSEGILDFPYVEPEEVDGNFVYNTIIRTKDYENKLKVIIEQKDCKKDYQPDGYYSLSVTINIDGRVYKSCGSKV